MKFANNKQAYLKGLLLLALAANATWEPAMRGLKSIDLAQEAVAPSGNADRVRVRTEGSGKLSASGNQGAAPSDKGVQPPAPAKPQGDKAPPVPAPRADAEEQNNEKPEAKADKPEAKPSEPSKVFDQEKMPANTCVGLPLDILYTQITENGRPVTEIAVARRFRSNSEDLLTNPIKQNGTIESIKSGSEAEKNELFAHLKMKVKAKIGAECKEEAAATTASTETKKAEPESRRTRLAERLAERDKKTEKGRVCAKDASGSTIKDKDEKVDCLLGKIEELDTEDENGKKKSAKSLMDSLESIVRDNLKDIIIEKLTSDDKDDEKDGERLNSLVMKLVKSTAKALKLDATKTQKLITELSALNAGGKAHRAAETLMAREEQLRDRYNTAAEMFQNNPNPWTAAQLNNLQWQRFNLATQMAQTAMPLYNMRQQGMMASDDYRTFLSPYAGLPDDMLRLANLRSLGIGPEMSAGGAGVGLFAGLAAPEDIMSVRGARGAAPTGRLAIRSSGAGTLPTTPPRLGGGLGGLGNYGSSLAVRPLGVQGSVFNNQPAYARPLSQPIYGGVQQNFARTYNPQPAYGQPTYGQPTYGQPTYARPYSSTIYGASRPTTQVSPVTNIPFASRY